MVNSMRDNTVGLYFSGDNMYDILQGIGSLKYTVPDTSLVAKSWRKKVNLVEVKKKFR